MDIIPLTFLQLSYDIIVSICIISLSFKDHKDKSVTFYTTPAFWLDVVHH